MKKCKCKHSRRQHYDNLMYPKNTHCSKCGCKEFIEADLQEEKDK